MNVTRWGDRVTLSSTISAVQINELKMKFCLWKEFVLCLFQQRVHAFGLKPALTVGCAATVVVHPHMTGVRRLLPGQKVLACFIRARPSDMLTTTSEDYSVYCSCCHGDVMTHSVMLWARFNPDLFGLLWSNITDFDHYLFKRYMPAVPSAVCRCVKGVSKVDALLLFFSVKPFWFPAVSQLWKCSFNYTWLF